MHVLVVSFRKVVVGAHGQRDGIQIRAIMQSMSNNTTCLFFYLASCGVKVSVLVALTSHESGW